MYKQTNKTNKNFLLQIDERERISKFRYRQDAKASIVGRLLMRFWAKQSLAKPNSALYFQRSERGRPILNQVEHNWDFNVSHAGEYTVFVAEGKYRFFNTFFHNETETKLF